MVHSTSRRGGCVDMSVSSWSDHQVTVSQQRLIKITVSAAKQLTTGAVPIDTQRSKKHQLSHGPRTQYVLHTAPAWQ